ncbi:MAG: cohesin domain-containing protein [Myxococcota bacterium]|nr:cohesin domain-containing protein [Myxococcota bacterium]
MEVVVQELGNGASPSLGSFDLRLDYDAAVVSAVQADFFGFLGAPLSLSDAQFEPGSLRIGEQSLLTDPAALDALQPDGFPLARISFDTLAIGTSELAFSLTLLVEARGGFLPLDGIGSAGIRVIPEPTTAALVGLGLLLTGLAAPRVR